MAALIAAIDLKLFENWLGHNSVATLVFDELVGLMEVGCEKRLVGSLLRHLGAAKMLAVGVDWEGKTSFEVSARTRSLVQDDTASLIEHFWLVFVLLRLHSLDT